MDLNVLWSIGIFVISSLAYISFSVVFEEVLAAALLPPERKKEDYVLPPLTTLWHDPQGLAGVLSFARLFFVIPALAVVFYWSFRSNGLVIIGSILGLSAMLILLPEWFVRRSWKSLFRSFVQITAYVLYPVFWLMSKLATTKEKQAVSEEERRNGNAAEQEEVDSAEFKGDIIKAISTIGETTVREVMTPRVDMVCISSTSTLDELHQAFKEHKFSRLPVFKEKVDNVIGIVSMIDLVGRMPNHDLSAPVTEIMRPAVFVPETKKVFTLLRDLRESRAQMAIVIDEYGGTSGLVTLEDLLEEIVGEIEDEHDEATFESIREKEGTYVVTGKFPVERLEDIFQVEVPAEDFETISGLIFSVLGRIPVVGEIVKYQNLKLEILEADKRRIHRLRIRTLPREEYGEESV